MVSAVSSLRQARISDAPVIANLRNRLAEHFFSNTPATEAQTRWVIKHTDTYVLEDDGKVIGSFALYNFRDDSAEFGHFMLEPDFQGQGYGNWMMAQALLKAKDMEIKTLRLVTKDNDHVAFHIYLKVGFLPTRIEGNRIYMEVSID